MFWFKIHVSKLHQFYASTISKIIFEKPKINNYFILGYYLFITLGCLTFIILNIGFSMHTMNVLEIPYETWEYPHIFIFFIEFFGLLTFSAITFMPLTVVLALFVETAGNLSIWINTLHEDIRNSELLIILHDKIHDCLNLLEGIKLTNATYSSILGVSFTGCLVICIFTTYRVLAFFIGNYEFNSAYTMIIIGYIGYTLLIGTFLIFSINVSQYIIDDLTQLKEALELLPITGPQI